MDDRSLTQTMFDEAPLRCHVDPLTKQARKAFDAEYEKRVEEMRKDWEHRKHYHCCFFCSVQSHEDKLIRNDKGYWIHPDCDNHWKETELNMKNKTR